MALVLNFTLLLQKLKKKIKTFYYKFVYIIIQFCINYYELQCSCKLIKINKN